MLLQINFLSRPPRCHTVQLINLIKKKLPIISISGVIEHVKKKPGAEVEVLVPAKYV
jgi:hypothetical protein